MISTVYDAYQSGDKKLLIWIREGFCYARRFQMIIALIFKKIIIVNSLNTNTQTQIQVIILNQKSVFGHFMNSFTEFQYKSVLVQQSQ